MTQYVILLLMFLFPPLFAIPQYYCTAASADYYPKLLGLIGSIHEFNYEDLVEIAVFDLGLTNDQIQVLNKIEKVQVYSFKEDNPHLLSYPIHGNFQGRIGAYSWKPVAIKEALDLFPYVLWIDAGTTVLKSMNSLFYSISEQGYFLCTIGDREPPGFPVDWSVNNCVRQNFDLNSEKNKKILMQEQIMAGVIGASRADSSRFIEDLYQLSKKIQYFIDDGTSLGGYGSSRPDQVLLTILAHLQNKKVYKQDHTQKKPLLLRQSDGKEIPFYITWDPNYVNSDTHIYSSRNDLSYAHKLLASIRWK